MSQGDILSFLTKNPGEHSIKEIANALDHSTNAICTSVKKLKWSKRVIVRRQEKSMEFWVKLPEIKNGNI